MPNIRRVMRYSNLDYHQTLELETDTFLLMLKNSVVEEWNSTEEGRAHLEKCHRLTIKEPDLVKLTILEKQLNQQV
jgi:hypothetical protein